MFSAGKFPGLQNLHNPSLSMAKAQPVFARAALIGDMLRVTGEFSIRKSDYGIEPVSATGGAIKLKDDLKLSFDISTRKQV